MHVPRAERRHRVRDAREQALGLLVRVVVAEARALDHRARDHVVVRVIAARRRERFPRAALDVLGEARGIAQRRCEDGGRGNAGDAAAQVHQHEPDRAADRCVRAKARAETAVAAVNADLSRVRPIHDHERRDTVHRALHAVQVELVAQHDFEPAEHDGQVFGLAARHQRVDRDRAHRGGLPSPAECADQFAGSRDGAVQHALDARLGGRHDRQAVRPRFLQEELEFVDHRQDADACESVELCQCRLFRRDLRRLDDVSRTCRLGFDEAPRTLGRRAERLRAELHQRLRVLRVRDERRDLLVQSRRRCLSACRPERGCRTTA